MRCANSAYIFSPLHSSNLKSYIQRSLFLSFFFFYSRTYTRKKKKEKEEGSVCTVGTRLLLWSLEIQTNQRAANNLPLAFASCTAFFFISLFFIFFLLLLEERERERFYSFAAFYILCVCIYTCIILLYENGDELK